MPGSSNGFSLSYLSTPAMSEVFSPRSTLRAMLAFEAGLARAEALAGVIPGEAARAIEENCKEEFFDLNQLFEEVGTAGTPAIPLLRKLTSQVGGEAGKFVHWGATSQDVIDTALMLQIQEGLNLLEKDLLALCSRCAKLAQEHRLTLMVGRTLLQQALPITFGLKAARWLGLAGRQVMALRECRERKLALQFGGAAGTLASLGPKGLEVSANLARELGLPEASLPWHTERDGIAFIGTSLGILSGSMSKIAGDVALLAQTEVGEAAEGAAPGKGGSSAMPQKRNPVDATLALAAARLAVGLVPVILAAMGQEHERAMGGWQAEWVAFPDLFRYTSKAVAGVRGAIEGLEVEISRMRNNLDKSNGLVMAESLTMALAAKIGRPAAFKLVEAASNKVITTGHNLREVVGQEPKVQVALSPEELEKALDPHNYLGSTAAFIDRALAFYQDLNNKG